MSYKKQKVILLLFIITAMSFYWYGCSQEPEEKGVKHRQETGQFEKTYDFSDNPRSAEIIKEKAEKSVNKTDYKCPDCNVILITIDTLRADHLGCYGYPRQTSPFIDKLARDGILFRRAFAHCATTVPSHASIFTSLYPIQHNVLSNYNRLDDSFLTMAEVFSTMGYQTAGFVSTWFFGTSSSNLSQGFDVFDGRGISKFEWILSRIKNFYKKWVYNKLPPPYRYRKAKGTVDAAIKWLDERRSTDRFFLWIHLFDPHPPYDPPALFLEIFTNQHTKEKDSFVRYLLEEHHIDFRFYRNKTKRMLRKINRYDSEILFVDTELKRLYKHLHKKGLDSDSLWILTSDHGQGLGNHRWGDHHKHIYNEQIRAPLIFHFSSGAFQGLSVDQIVEHVDILPTVVDLVGGELSNQIKSVQGVSLVPLFFRNEKVRPIKNYAFAQRREYDKKGIDQKKLFQNKKYEVGEKYALLDNEYKYIYHTLGKDEFFDLRKDPYELNNLIGSGTEEEIKLRNAIISKIKLLKQDSGAKIEFEDKEAIEQLKSLGYIQ